MKRINNLSILHSTPRAEAGSIDSFLILIPTLMLTTSLLGIFHYGLTQNQLASSATLLGRQLARQPSVGNLNELTQKIISRENLGDVDFHVMRYPIGNQSFIQLVLVGRPVRIGWSTLTPSARSLTLVDQWQ